MSEEHNAPTHRRPDLPSMGAPHLEFNLASELQMLQQEPEWEKGHNSKTLVKYDNLRIVLIALRKDARIPDHRTEGRISIQTIRGHILVRASGRVFELPIGRLLALELTAETLLRDIIIAPDRLDPAARVFDSVVTLLPGEKQRFNIDSKAELTLDQLTTRPVWMCVNNFGAAT